MAQFEYWMTTDLKHGSSQVHALHGQTFTQDNLGNRVGVIVLDGGRPATLNGAVTGYVIRADGGTVVVVGTVDGNKAYIDLPESAYAVPGQIQIAIRLISGETKTVLGALNAYVRRTATGTIIDPGHVIPDIDDIIAKMAEVDAKIVETDSVIDAAEAATVSANNATKYIAETEATNTASAAHAVGSYFIYNGKLVTATSAIAQGATIVPYASGVTNFNCAEVPNGLSSSVFNVTNTANAAANNAADAQQLVAPVESFAGMPTGPATKAHATGSYFVYGSMLYKATTDIAIGDPIVTNGTGANAAQVPGGAMGEVAELMSAIANERDGIALLSADAIIQGSFNGQGGVTVNPARIRNSGFIQVFKGQKIHFVPGETTTQFLYGTFTVEKIYVADSVWVSEAIDIDINADGYIIVVFANATKTNIEPTDYDAEFAILTKWRSADIELSKDIASIDSEIDDFIRQYYKSNNISQIPNVTKLAGYSFGPSGTKVSGSVSSSYDSYYFYADADTALYFDNVAPSSPAYIAITVGYDPTKNWTGSSGGTLQMACSSVIRKRKSESNLPVSSEPLDVGGAIVIFTVNASTTTNVYINNGLKLQDEVRLNQAQIDQVIESIPERDKSPKLIYTTIQEFEYEKSTEQINIYLPTKYGYIRYAFGHSVDANINADSWRIFRAIAVDGNLTDRFRITAYGEWEMALKLDGSTDFIGGVLHGDEVMEDVTFFLDGKETDISMLTSLTDFTELRIVENTLLYNPDVANENVAAHSKEYVFTADGVTINQRVKWLMAKTLTTSYSCMFPLIRGNDTVSELQITADYYDDNDYKTYDVSVGGMSGYPFTWHSGVTRANLWAEESGIFASAEIVKQPPALTGGGMSFLQNTVNQYNKLYFSICGIGATYTTSANETWRWSQRYTISAVEIN